MLLAISSEPIPSWLSSSVWPVIVAQAVAGIIGLIGIIAILRRFLNTEFPAAMHAVNDRLDTLHTDFETLEREFRAYQLKIERLEERLETQRSRLDRLDETGAFRRPPNHR